METLKDVLVEQIKDLYSAEKQLTKALPRMAKKAKSDELRKGFEKHLAETEKQVTRLEQVATELDIKPSGVVCKAMKGLIEEGKEALSEKGKTPLIDIMLVSAAQRIEHYEISGYGTARALAQHLGFEKAAKLLDQTLAEEAAADEKLTAVTQKSLLKAADAASAK